MSGQAKVISAEALEAFRATLIVYLSQMQPGLEEAGGEVARTKQWLEVEQRQFWENQLRLRRRKLEEAQTELFSAKLSRFSQSSTLQTMAVQRARLAVEEAERKLAAIKKWARELDTRAGPMLKQVEQLQGYLAAEMGNAVFFLIQIIQTLAAYRDVLPGNSPAPALPPIAADPDPTP
jgi:cob(I)alamin adenosyltransferase